MKYFLGEMEGSRNGPFAFITKYLSLLCAPAKFQILFENSISVLGSMQVNPLLW